ncbi:MAG: DNRLRE domain-containing protein, partial [Clostridia bacterium]|nr:DNRLRE domain-containing protein [Clostridia bacterium]
SMTHTTVREDQQYIVTIHIDAEYLKDEKTKYPIRIDPTIEITYDGNGASAIQDVTLNQNSGSSGTSGSLYVGKRNTYGISRTLMKFPGLNLGAISSANNITSAYVEIRDMMCETTIMTVYGYIFDGNEWSESTANWSNVDPNSWTEMPNAYADVCYSNGAAKNPAHRYSIDITQAVKSWKTGFYSQSKGIMLRASDSVESGSALYKTFASYNRASNKPSLKVNYVVYATNAVLLGIPDDENGHDHSSWRTTVGSHLQSIGFTYNSYYGDSTVATVESYLDNNQNSVFVSRSHGYLQEAGSYIFQTGIQVSSQSLASLTNMNINSSLDLSNLKLVVLCACETGKGGEGADNLPSKLVNMGAVTAIGFVEEIDCRDANQWTKEFFKQLSYGNTVQSAINRVFADDELIWHYSSITQITVCGNKQTVLQ